MHISIYTQDNNTTSVFPAILNMSDMNSQAGCDIHAVPQYTDCNQLRVKDSQLCFIEEQLAQKEVDLNFGIFQLRNFMGLRNFKGLRNFQGLRNFYEVSKKAITIKTVI